jgi:hypothetical protein
MSDTRADVPTTRSNWRQVSAAGDRLLLAVHFESGRDQAGLADLSAGLPGFRMLESQPAYHPAGLPGQVEPARYLDAWVDELTSHVDRVDGVLGYCAGSGLAGKLVARLADAGLGRARLIAFDPLEVNAALLREEYRVAVDALAGQADPAIVAEARGVADERVGTVVELAASMYRAHGTLCAAACRRLGVSDAFQNQLRQRFGSYLGYLVAAADAAAPSGVDSLVVRSRSGGAGPANSRGSVVFDVAPAALLADRAVAQFVGEAMTRP